MIDHDSSDLPREYLAACGCQFKVAWHLMEGNTLCPYISDEHRRGQQSVFPCKQHPGWSKIRKVWRRARVILQMQYSDVITTCPIYDRPTAE